MSNKICLRCIMDTSDPNITFDSRGVCNHCHAYDDNVARYGYHGKSSDEALAALVEQMKRDGKGKEYDCMLGLSGGVDSSYMLYQTRQFGLRPMVVHVDAGWNDNRAEENIRKLCHALDYKIHCVSIDWDTMKELQRAFMFSGLPNLDIPQDHAFAAGVYEMAKKHNLSYILNGSNFSSEGILPQAWAYASIDFRHIQSVYKKHGRGFPLRKYSHFGLIQYSVYQKTMKRVKLLNYIPYSTKAAIETLSREFNWQYYGSKHYESIFTRFMYTSYLLPKFGYDMRRAHLASLVVSGDITREEALKQMESPPLSSEQLRKDCSYVLERLDISLQEWQTILAAPNNTENDYASNAGLLRMLLWAKRLIG